jgi:hypothetical protein
MLNRYVLENSKLFPPKPPRSGTVNVVLCSSVSELSRLVSWKLWHRAHLDSAPTQPVCWLHRVTLLCVIIYLRSTNKSTNY